MEIKTYNEIYSDIRNYIIGKQSKVTDFNEGSVLSSLVEAYSRELAMLYISCRVGFSSHLRELPYSVFGFRPKAGQKASADVIFSRAKPGDTMLIPNGTVVKSGSLRFVTTESSAIEAGKIDSPRIPVAAEEAGEKYNVRERRINQVDGFLSKDLTVRNEDSATGGTNSESWADFIKRFSDYILGLQRTNNKGLSLALAEVARSWNIIEHFPPLDGIWNMTIYLEDGSGGLSAEDFARVKKIIDGDIAKGIGGYRAPGINIRYMPPEVVPIAIELTIKLDTIVAGETAQSTVVKQVEEAVRRHINNLKIGQNVCTSVLTAELVQMPALRDAHIMDARAVTEKEEEEETKTEEAAQNVADIQIAPHQIARFDECIVLAEV